MEIQDKDLQEKADDLQNNITEYRRKHPLVTKRKPNVRELVLKNGMQFPSDEELVMLLLGSGTKKVHVEQLASRVISAINDCNAENRIDALKKIEGIGETKALLIAAALELGRRKSAHLHAVINKPRDIVPYVQHYSMQPKEHFICATINGARELLNIRVISIGTINRTLIHPREIFSDAVAEHASGIICCHNHPYGPCLPSQADCDSTDVLRQAADILGITFLDHIIITQDTYFSFLEHGLLGHTEQSDSECHAATTMVQ